MKDMLSQVLTFLRYKDSYSEKEQAFLRKEMMRECDERLKWLTKYSRDSKINPDEDVENI